MGRLDKTPQPVREAIAAALMIGAVTATAAALLHEPLFIPGGFALFLIFYVWRIRPQIRAAYAQQEQATHDEYADDATYEPILERFEATHNDTALVDAYHAWASGPHSNQVKLRFLQTAMLNMIEAKAIYHVEDLMVEAQEIAAEEGLSDRFERFRRNCDQRIAEIARERLQ